MPAGCWICGDNFDSAIDIVATECGHLFHNYCIGRFVSYSCPECRNHIIPENSLKKLFFHDFSRNNVENSLDALKEQLRTKDLELMEQDKKIEKFLADCAETERRTEKMLRTLMDLQNDVSNIETDVQQLSPIKAKHEMILQVNNNLQTELGQLGNVKKIAESCFNDAKKLLNDMQIHTSSEEGKVAAQRLATYCSVLKRDIGDSKEEKTQLQNQITELKRQMEILHADPKKKIGRGNQAGDNFSQSSGLAGSSLAHCSRARSDTKKENSVSQYRYRLRSHARVVKRKLDK